MTLILASSSPYRLNLLKKAGLKPITDKPEVDESLIKKKYFNKGPLYVAKELAKLKSESIAFKNSYTAPFVIIGSDQVCVFENQILDKPGSFENNFIHLKKLQSKTHTLITAVCYIYKLKQDDPFKYIEFYNETRLTMKPLTDEDIRSYLKKDAPYDCAGGYKFESQGHTLIDHIKSEDLTAIEGLPMKECLKQLSFLDFSVF